MKIFFFEIAEQNSKPYVYTGHKSLKDFQRIDFTAEQAAALEEFIASGRGTSEYWPEGV